MDVSICFIHNFFCFCTGLFIPTIFSLHFTDFMDPTVSRSAAPEGMPKISRLQGHHTTVLSLMVITCLASLLCALSQMKTMKPGCLEPKGTSSFSTPETPQASLSERVTQQLLRKEPPSAGQTSASSTSQLELGCSLGLS